MSVVVARFIELYWNEFYHLKREDEIFPYGLNYGLIMDIECAYSFDDLHKAAFGFVLHAGEKEKFMSKPQREINELVRHWTEKAGWETRTRIGTDGKTYVAFAPSFSAQSESKVVRCEAEYEN